MFHFFRQHKRKKILQNEKHKKNRTKSKSLKSKENFFFYSTIRQKKLPNLIFDYGLTNLLGCFQEQATTKSIFLWKLYSYFHHFIIKLYIVYLFQNTHITIVIKPESNIKKAIQQIVFSTILYARSV